MRQARPRKRTPILRQGDSVRSNGSWITSSAIAPQEATRDETLPRHSQGSLAREPHMPYVRTCSTYTKTYIISGISNICNTVYIYIYALQMTIHTLCASSHTCFCICRCQNGPGAEWLPKRLLKNLRPPDDMTGDPNTLCALSFPNEARVTFHTVGIHEPCETPATRYSVQRSRH